MPIVTSGGMHSIGGSDLDVFPLALGGNVFGWTADKAVSFQILDAYTAAGGDFLDTADSYSAFAPGNHGGESETIIGEWMAARRNRDEIVVATKVSRTKMTKLQVAENPHQGCFSPLATLALVPPITTTGGPEQTV
jgi:aryl-alcohol dehydrogenase-like predicted oxidoreductase